MKAIELTPLIVGGGIWHKWRCYGFDWWLLF